MESTKLIFLGTKESKTDGHELEVYHNSNNEIYINIDLKEGDYGFICLDKPTAIKLHRELKKQISFIKS